jgi:hypothetical protein
VRASGLPESALVIVGTDHRLADSESLKVMLRACESKHDLIDRMDAV